MDLFVYVVYHRQNYVIPVCSRGIFCVLTSKYSRDNPELGTPSIKGTTLLITLTKYLLNIKKYWLNKISLLSTEKSSPLLQYGDVGNLVAKLMTNLSTLPKFFKVICSPLILTQFFCHGCACVFAPARKLQSAQSPLFGEFLSI